MMYIGQTALSFIMNRIKYTETPRSTREWRIHKAKRFQLNVCVCSLGVCVVWLPLIQLLCRFRCSDCEHFEHCRELYVRTGEVTYTHKSTHTHTSSQTSPWRWINTGTLSTFRWPLLHYGTPESPYRYTPPSCCLSTGIYKSPHSTTKLHIIHVGTQHPTQKPHLNLMHATTEIECNVWTHTLYNAFITVVTP